MRRIIAVLGVIIGLGGSAWAADLPPSPPPRAPAVYVPAVLPVYNWAGVYIGINGGWGWGNGKFTIAPNTAFPAGLSGTPNDNGGVVGGTLGANFQTGGIVFGRRGRLGLFCDQYRYDADHLQHQRQLSDR
jgi:outer membrane immunogenic protein